MSPNQARKTSVALQGTIISFHLIEGMSFSLIAKKTGVPKTTCHEVFRRAEEAANYSKNVHDYLNMIDQNYGNRGARPRRIQPGSEASKQARQAALDYDEHYPNDAVNYRHHRQPL